MKRMNATEKHIHAFRMIRYENKNIQISLSVFVVAAHCQNLLDVQQKTMNKSFPLKKSLSKRLPQTI